VATHHRNQAWAKLPDLVAGSCLPLFLDGLFCFVSVIDQLLYECVCDAQARINRADGICRITSSLNFLHPNSIVSASPAETLIRNLLLLPLADITGPSIISPAIIAFKSDEVCGAS